MSGYLDHLAAKALNRTEVVQPRLASLFEPPPAASGLGSGHLSSNLETAPDEQRADTPLIDSLWSAQGHLHSALPSHPSVKSRIWPADTTLQQPGAGGAAQSAGSSLPPDAARLFDAQTGQQSLPGTPILASATGGQHPGAVPSSRTSEQDGQSALEPFIRRVLDEQAGLLDVPPSRNLAGPGLIANQTRRALTPEAVVIQPHMRPHREPPDAVRSEPSTTSEPAPVIKSTIGRVDVRAIMPASPAPRPVPVRPNSRLSLEDYLKQREGERR